MKTVAISGYFVWLHIGYLDYFKEAKKLGRVVAIVNNDSQQILKYGKVIVPLEERMEIVSNFVDEVVESIDSDRTVCKTLEKIRPDIFLKGGDRTKENIPEVDTCKKLGIELVFAGVKRQSSSTLIKRVENFNPL